MNTPGESTAPSPPPWQPKRPDTSRMTIGLLATSLADSRIMAVYNGAAEVAHAEGVNLICYIAGKVDSPKVVNTGVRDAFTELISPAALDGLLTVQYWFTREWFLHFCQSYIDMPIVTAFRNYEGFGGAAVDTQQGDRSLVEHLIKDHGYTRIAYVCARLDVAIFQQRYQAYRDVCSEQQIAHNEDLIIRFEDWTGPFHPVIDPKERAQAAISTLIDERKLIPGQDFQAIICAWEPLAIQLVHELQRRGYRVPQDVAVAGDENTREGALITPALTTVGINWYEVGRQSARILLARIRDPQYLEHVQVAAHAVLRRSCGCHPAEVKQAAFEAQLLTEQTEPPTAMSRDTVMAELQQGTAQLTNNALAAAHALLDSFTADIGTLLPVNEDNSRFLAELEHLIRSAGEAPLLAAGQSIFNGLRQYARTQYTAQLTRIYQAESLLQQGGALLKLHEENIQAFQRMEQDRLLSTLQTMSQRLMTAFDLPTLLQMLAQHLPELGITRSYISMYEDNTQPNGTARLLMAFDEQGLRVLPEEGIPFTAAMLAPADTLPQDALWNMVVEPLYFGSDQIGFIVFETTRQDPRIYALLRSEISNAIKSALLMQRVNKRSADLEQSNAALQESIASLKHYQNQLIRSEKMAALGQLVAGVAHEINTPIGIGVTAASFLEQESRQLNSKLESQTLRKSDLTVFAKEAMESSRLILTNLSRADELVQSFKRVAVDQSYEESREFQLAAYLQDVLLSLQPVLRKGQHHVELQCPEQLRIYCAPGDLYQIITNLVVNSALHGFENTSGGHIRIEVGRPDQQTLQLHYADDGQGMDEATLGRLFDPFFTTRRGQGSTGLGMHIVYNLITQKLQGSIDCHSSPNMGVRFNIRIPLITGITP